MTIKETITHHDHSYPDKTVLPKYFSGPIIRQAVAPVAEEYADLQVTVNERDATATFVGLQTEADDLSSVLPDLYADLGEEYKHWKTDNAYLKSLKGRQDQYRLSHLARRDFVVAFTTGYLEFYYGAEQEDGPEGYREGVEAARKKYGGADPADEPDDGDDLI